MARPRNVKIDALFVEPLSEWTVPLVRSAINLHEQGRLRQSARLADAMGRDPRISGARSTRVRALTSRGALPFAVETSEEGDGRKRKAAAARQRELWWYACPETEIAPILADAIMLGVAVARLEWISTDGEWVPRLVWLPPHGLSWEQYGLAGATDGRAPCWVYTTWDGQRFEVRPGDGTWFLYTPGGARSWMNGVVRMLGLPWYMGVCTERDWARFDEKHGLPILSIDEPHWAADDVEGEEGADGTKADQYYSQFRNMAAESVLRNPQGPTKDDGGWAAKWLEPESESWSSFKDHLDYIGRLIEQAILGRDSAAGPKGGDGELATERVRVEYLASDAETLATALREQVWKPWAEFNYGDRDVAGWGRWNTRPPPDLKLRAETLKTASEALEKLVPMGIAADPVLEEFGLAAGDGGVKAPPSKPAAPPGGATEEAA
jgi:phage gp29-like protein